MLTLALSSFVAGMLTILAPCVLPVLPVVLSTSIWESKKWYPYIVISSLAFSIVVFTLLLKVSTIFLSVPSSFWKYISWGILLLLWLVYLFPHVWAWIWEKCWFSHSTQVLENTQNIWNPLVRAFFTGAALGPVFSTCSPTYAYLLATVFPVSLLAGTGYILVYALWLSVMLLLITLGWRAIIKRLWFFSREQWIFRKGIGIILVLIGTIIMLWVDKKIEAWVLERFDISAVENVLVTPFIPLPNSSMNTPSVSPNASAYFAGGCFWCMEGIFEAQEGVKEAIAGYAEWDATDANYEAVSSGNTKHREAVRVIYNPEKISFANLVDLYYSQIDPTQTDGQFADKGFRYTTAIYYQNDTERSIIENAKAVLEASHKYTKPIAVQEVPFTTFFPAEEYHQDYYKKSAFRYNLYKEGSGRAAFIRENGQTGATLSGKVSPDTQKNQYRDYDESELETLTGTRILLFFHADWCPTCRNFDTQIREASLPSDVVIYKVDYDTETALKRKYSILSQSTWVQIDNHGNMYKRWLGKSLLSDILWEMLSPKELLSHTLTPIQFEVTQMGWTEKPFDNAYWDNHDPGIYVDIVDGTPLFSSTDKFDSNTGWPSFSRPIDENMISEHLDTNLAMNRTEVKSTAGSHLGHVFTDGPKDEGWLRYCINSAALRFVPLADLEKEGYGKYKVLFEK